MQIPYRKPPQFASLQPDPMLTPTKFEEPTIQLEDLKTASRPHAAAEVSRLAELGDFSQNAEYQIAKGRLRGINNRILTIENHLKQAVIIATPQQADTVKIGHTVTIVRDGLEKTYQILGSSESKPGQGIISYNSPLGAVLLGHAVGDSVTVTLGDKEVVYSILKIE